MAIFHKKSKEDTLQEQGRHEVVRRHGNGHGLAPWRTPGGDLFERLWHGLESHPLAHWGAEVGGLWPALDMVETDKEVTIAVDVPGMDPKDIDIEVSGNRLTLRGQRSDERSDNKGGVYRRERHSGSFERTVTLPDYADADKIEARYQNGTLTLRIPKVEGRGPKRVQVR